MRGTWLVSACLAAALGGCECGGSSDDDDDDGGGGDRRWIWSREEVEELADRVGLSIAGDGTPVLGLMTWVEGTPWVAVARGAGLEVELVVELADTAQLISVQDPVAAAHDSAGRVHLAWTDGVGVSAAIEDGDGWTVELVAAAGSSPALAVDGDDRPHVVFLEPGVFRRQLFHAVRTEAGWSPEPVLFTRTTQESARVGFALVEDEPWIVTSNEDGSSLVLARPDGGGGWATESVFTGEPIAGMTAMTLDAAGAPWVAFITQTDAIYLAHRDDGGAWATELVTREDAPFSSSTSGWIGIDVATDGSLFVAGPAESRFGSATSFDGVMLFRRASDASTWGLQQLLGQSCTGTPFALELDATGALLFAYSCEGAGIMSVIGEYPDGWQARCDALAATLCEGACACENVDEDCNWVHGDSHHGTSAFGCGLNLSEDLCGDPTVTPDMLAACEAEAASSECVPTDDGDALQLSPACDAIPAPR